MESKQETLYDHIFTDGGIRGKVYVHKTGERYTIDTYSIDNNTMRVDFGNSQGIMKILPHLHDKHVVSLSRGDLETLANAQEAKN